MSNQRLEGLDEPDIAPYRHRTRLNQPSTPLIPHKVRNHQNQNHIVSNGQQVRPRHVADAENPLSLKIHESLKRFDYNEKGRARKDYLIEENSNIINLRQSKRVNLKLDENNDSGILSIKETVTDSLSSKIKKNKLEPIDLSNSQYNQTLINSSLNLPKENISSCHQIVSTYKNDNPSNGGENIEPQKCSNDYGIATMHLKLENKSESLKSKKYTGRVFIENWDLDSTLYH
jgi:hypothetical protein